VTLKLRTLRTIPKKMSDDQLLEKVLSGLDGSPFKAGECLCGVADCTGHEAIDGKICIPNHPLGPIEITVGSQSDDEQREKKAWNADAPMPVPGKLSDLYFRR
jgi:hypothetical protein